jgi:hypothetical protein
VVLLHVPVSLLDSFAGTLVIRRHGVLLSKMDLNSLVGEQGDSCLRVKSSVYCCIFDLEFLVSAYEPVIAAAKRSL